MTLQEMLAEIPRLTPYERLLLLEAVTRSLHEELTPDQLAAREATVERLFGALRSQGQSPTDDDLREGYTDYLNKKYS